jgi:hypothetical protein
VWFRPGQCQAVDLKQLHDRGLKCNQLLDEAWEVDFSRSNLVGPRFCFS